jgi:hypothetical protein
MSRRLSVLVVLGMLGFGGCASMEQYHFVPTYSEVPVKVKLAFSEKYPNDVIKTDGTLEEKMFDGTVRYRLTVTDSKNVQREVLYTAEGQEI